MYQKLDINSSVQTVQKWGERNECEHIQKQVNIIKYCTVYILSECRFLISNDLESSVNGNLH